MNKQEMLQRIEALERRVAELEPKPCLCRQRLLCFGQPSEGHSLDQCGSMFPADSRTEPTESMVVYGTIYPTPAISHNRPAEPNT